MILLVLVINVLCLFVSHSVGKDLDYLREQPSYMKSCEINKPDFVNCSTAEIQSLFKQFKAGVPGLESLGSIDPFHISKVKFKQDNNNVANIAATLTDIMIYGVGDIIVKYSGGSKKDYSWHTKFLLPKIRLESNYVLDGQILIIPLKGNGTVQVELENLNLEVLTKTRLYEKGNFTFFNVTKVRINLDVTGFKANFENLFNGNKEIEDSTNIFFNENWKELFDAMRPIIKKTLQDILYNLYQKIFSFIPANFFLSDIPTSKELYGTRKR